MKMKKSRLVCIILITAMLLCSCGFEKFVYNEGLDKKFNIDYYNISLTTSQEWSDAEASNFDLQLTNGNANISIMAYNEIDISQEQTAESIYEWHNEDIFSRRENVNIVEPLEVIDTDDKKITVTLYSAEKEGVKNYYYSYLVEFEESEGIFAWVLLNGSPSYIMKNKDSFTEIIKSMEYSIEMADNKMIH